MDQFRCILKFSQNNRPQCEALENNYRVCGFYSPEARDEVCFVIGWIFKIYRNWYIRKWKVRWLCRSWVKKNFPSEISSSSQLGLHASLFLAYAEKTILGRMENLLFCGLLPWNRRIMKLTCGVLYFSAHGMSWLQNICFSHGISIVWLAFCCGSDPFNKNSKT